MVVVRLQIQQDTSWSFPIDSKRSNDGPNSELSPFNGNHRVSLLPDFTNWLDNVVVAWVGVVVARQIDPCGVPPRESVEMSISRTRLDGTG